MAATSRSATARWAAFAPRRGSRCRLAPLRPPLPLSRLRGRVGVGALSASLLPEVAERFAPPAAPRAAASPPRHTYCGRSRRAPPPPPRFARRPPPQAGEVRTVRPATCAAAPPLPLAGEGWGGGAAAQLLAEVAERFLPRAAP